MAKKDTHGAHATPLNVLTVGTRILRKDLMDQHIRSLGEFRTYYAANLTWALRSLAEKKIDLIISEMELDDGSIFRLKQQGIYDDNETYTILATESDGNFAINVIQATVRELEINGVLLAPFNGTDIKRQIELFLSWHQTPRAPWRLSLCSAAASIRAGNLVEAELAYSTAIAMGPTNPEPFLKAGLFHLKQGSFPVAREFLERALELRPGYVQALNALGLLYLSQDELDEAETTLIKAQTLSPLNPDRAATLAELQLKKALAECEWGTRHFPGHFRTRLMLAKLHVVQKKLEPAIEELTALLAEAEEPTRLEIQTYLNLAKNSNPGR